MYKLSVWASRHVWPARIAIIGSYVLLTDLGLFIGGALQLFKIAIPVSLFYSAVVLFLALYLLYPDKRQKHRFRHFYRYQKTCDFILVSATFFFIVCIGNQPKTFGFLGTQAAAATGVSYAGNEAATWSPPNKGGIKKPAKGVSKRSMRQVLLEKIHVLRKAYKKTSTGGKIALIALAALVAFGLLTIVGSLSCNLSCSGNDGAAILVAIGGITLITFLLVKVIRRIIKGPRPKVEPEQQAT